VIIKMLHLALTRNFFLPPTPASQIKEEATTIAKQAPTPEQMKLETFGGPSLEPQTHLTVDIRNRERVLHVHTNGQRTMVQQYPFYLPCVPCPKKIDTGSGYTERKCGMPLVCCMNFSYSNNIPDA
jgi:hypothetical protein